MDDGVELISRLEAALLMYPDIMAKRLVSLRELDEIEGLVERHRKMQERIEALEAEAAEYDTAAQGVLELGRKTDELRRELAALLEQILTRIKR